MTVIRNNSISGINSITAQSNSLQFYDSAGNTLAISADVTGGVTVATGATISGSTDTVIISTNGSERVRINSSGRVGIGTDNPTEELHITAETPVIRLEDSDTGGQSQIVGIDGNLRFDSDNNNAQASSNISFRTDGSERLNITSSGNVQIANGNLVFSTAGTGIDFSANSNAAGMTSELLDDYEEGTWTPTQGSFSTWTSPTFNATYTKVGRLVTVVLYQTGGTVGWSVQQRIDGLPFAPSTPSTGYFCDNFPDQNGGILVWTNSGLYFASASASETEITVRASYFTNS